MKNFILYIFLSIFLLVSTLCTAQEYGAGVKHRNGAPVDTPQYSVKPSLVAYDSLEQALYVNNKNFGWWKLLSPLERYVRAIANINFGNGQSFTWSQIEAFINTSNGGSQFKKNGYYLVKFTANATATDAASVDFTSVLITVPANPIPISNNDYFLVRYYRGALISLVWMNDKQNISFNIINNQVDFHTRQIDSLKIRLDTLNVTPPTPSVSSNVDSFFKKYYQYIPLTDFLCSDTLRYRYQTFNINDNNFFAVPPQMVGDTLVGFYASICQPSNNAITFRFCRIKPDGLIQYFIQYAASRMEAGQKTKFFNQFFSVQHSILQADDRIYGAFFGYIQFISPLVEAQGLSFTIVVKPKLR